MKALPARSGFGETYAAGKPQVVWTTLVSDLETPVSAMIKLADGQSNCFLLESVTGGEVRGRYSFIGLKPAGGTAADGRRIVRLSRLRHGAAD
jgi:anthranilate synthase component 1